MVRLVNSWLRLACMACLSLCACIPLVHAQQEGAASEVLSVGVVPQFDMRRIHAVWNPILDELEKRTGLKFVLRGAATIPAFERELVAGAYDLAYINPYHVVKFAERQGYRPLVRDAQDLYGVLVVPKESPIQSVQELNGKTVAFPAPNSLGATLLIRAELFYRYGIELVPKIVQSHSSVYLNVALGEAIAGGGVQKTLDQQSDELKDKLRILYKTESVPSHPLVVHSRVPVAVQARLYEALIELGNDPVGRELLSKVPMTELKPTFINEYKHLGEMGLERFW